MRTIFRLSLSALHVGAMSLILASPAPAANIFDDFNDGVIDLTKWTPRPAWTGHQSFRDSMVEETGGQLVLRNRGYLVSAEQFDPSAGLVVTGRAMAPVLLPPSLGGDFFQVAIRSNGMPDVVPSSPGQEWGEVEHGIECIIQVRSPAVWICGCGNTSMVIARATSPVP
jgi:hypothetical protein